MGGEITFLSQVRRHSFRDGLSFVLAKLEFFGRRAFIGYSKADIGSILCWRPTSILLQGSGFRRRFTWHWDGRNLDVSKAI